MRKLVNPVLFSKHFGITPETLKRENLVDPILNCDTRLFIDPLLISTSGNRDISAEGFTLLKKRFKQIIRLIAASRKENDKAWRTAAELLDLSERPETCLGYGGSDTSGSSRPTALKQSILQTAREIVLLGEDDPEIISLMGLFEDGVGPDTISDLTTNMLLPALCRSTEAFCARHGLTTRRLPRFSNFQLPENPYRPNAPILLVPRDVVRELPLAADWKDVSAVVLEITEIRREFNSFVSGIAEATLSEKKAALKRAALSSLSNFTELFHAVLGASNHYDPNIDTLNFYSFRQLMSGNLTPFKTPIAPPSTPTIDELLRVVRAIIKHFRKMVEKNNLWELLWDGARPKRERAAQLIFFAVADLFCKANNVDISPETNMGGGPVDFKFSSGYAARVVVEVKLSKGAVVSGYERQIEIYKSAAETEKGIFLVIDVGGMGNKLATIKHLQHLRLSKGESPSEIEVVDGRSRPSASKS